MRGCSGSVEWTLRLPRFPGVVLNQRHQLLRNVNRQDVVQECVQAVVDGTQLIHHGTDIGITRDQVANHQLIHVRQGLIPTFLAIDESDELPEELIIDSGKSRHTQFRGLAATRHAGSLRASKH